MSQGGRPAGEARFCPTCGARNPAGAPRCAVCGQPLAGAKPDDRNRARPAPGGEIIDLYPVPDPSLQATMPFTQTRPFEPPVPRTTPSPLPVQPAARAEATSPAMAALGRPAAVSSTLPAPTATAPRRGPHGCVLGCLALVLIGAVAAVVAWGAVQAALSDRVEDELAVGIANGLRTVDRVRVPANGQIVVTEEAINADLARDADLYAPVENVRVAVTEDGIAVDFDLYRVGSTFRGGLAVEEGRIVVTDPELSGVAARAIDIEDVAAIVEREVAGLLDRSGVRPTGVRLRDGSIVVITEPMPVLGT